MGNKDHSHSLTTELAENVQQHADLFGIQAGGWLIKNQDFGGQIDGPRDSDNLLDGNGVITQRLADVQLQPIPQ
ncbi:hypothetical protein D3C71_1647280 [compost metagenome]